MCTTKVLHENIANDNIIKLQQIGTDDKSLDRSKEVTADMLIGETAIAPTRFKTTSCTT